MVKTSQVKKLYNSWAPTYDITRGVWNFFAERGLKKRYLFELKRSLKKDLEILDLGCGTGYNIKNILKLNKNFKSYLGIDFSEEMLEKSIEKFSKNKKVFFRKEDLIKWKSKKRYDLIISTMILSHINNPSDLINKYYSFLNFEGRMILTFLTEPRWYVSWFSLFMKPFPEKYVSEEDIHKFNGKKIVESFFGNLLTLVVINKGEGK